MEKVDIIKYWIDSSDRDFKTMKNLFKEKDYHWALFIGHLVIEKLLKAYYEGKEDKELQYFFPNFDKLRVKSKIKMKVLYDSEARGKPITKLELMETKFLPKEYSSPAVINIYADRVVNVLWKGNNPLCFMIINKDIADSYRKWFELLWKYSR